MNYKYKEVILSVNVHHYLSQFRVTTGSCSIRRFIQFALSRGPRIWAQRTAINLRILLTIFK